jgi:peptidoglycan/xylan/chitin deacetylase (PgdA/CDA1 family)
MLSDVMSDPMSIGKRVMRRPAAAALAALARRRAGGLGLVLCYHRIGDPQGRAGRELVPALGTSAFMRQLEYLRRSYRLVPAGELYEAAVTRRRGERIPLAITFDDDLEGHTSVAAPLLRAAGAQATFFVGGATLDGPRAFWWQVLQRALDGGTSLDDPLLPQVPAVHEAGGVHRVSDAVRTLPRAERDALTQALLERIGGEPPEAGLGADQIRSLVDDGFELGFHTRDHESLELLGDAELASALTDGRERLEELTGRPLRTIAYPFGRADERVARAARDAGFTAGFTLATTPVQPSDDPLLLGRFQPDFAGPGQTVMALARSASASLRRPSP